MINSTVVSELVEEYERQAEKPPTIKGEPDEAIALFACAMVEHIESNAATQELLDRSISQARNTKPFPAVYAANFIMRLCQMQWMERPSYPFKTKRSWRRNIDLLFSDPQRSKEIEYPMLMWNVGSDIETRIASLKLVAHTLQADRVDDPDDRYTILNVGSSRDHGLAMIAGDEQFPEISVEAPPSVPPFSADELAAATREINRRINSSIRLGDCYGVDVWPLRDPLYSRFLQACRFYPSELRDPYKRKLYEKLERIRDDSQALHHVTADFGRLDEEKPNADNGYLNAMRSAQFDMVMFSTCLYQNFPEKRRNMLQEGVARLRRHGKMIVQDFCDIRPLGGDVQEVSDQVVFHERWYSQPYGYITAVYDAADPEAGLQPLGEWSSSRCERMRPSGVLLRALAIR